MEPGKREVQPRLVEEITFMQAEVVLEAFGILSDLHDMLERSWDDLATNTATLPIRDLDQQVLEVRRKAGRILNEAGYNVGDGEWAYRS